VGQPLVPVEESANGGLRFPSRDHQHGVRFVRVGAYIGGQAPWRLSSGACIVPGRVDQTGHLAGSGSERADAHDVGTSVRHMPTYGLIGVLLHGVPWLAVIVQVQG